MTPSAIVRVRNAHLSCPVGGTLQPGRRAVVSPPRRGPATAAADGGGPKRSWLGASVAGRASRSIGLNMTARVRGSPAARAIPLVGAVDSGVGTPPRGRSSWSPPSGRSCRPRPSFVAAPGRLWLRSLATRCFDEGMQAGLPICLHHDIATFGRHETSGYVLTDPRARASGCHGRRHPADHAHSHGLERVVRGRGGRRGSRGSG
jgi:hypothetical protein